MTSPSHVSLMDKVRDDSSYTSQHSGRSEDKYSVNTNTGTPSNSNNQSVGTSNSNAQTKGKPGSNRASLESPFPHVLQTSLEGKEEENGYKGNVLSYVVKHLLSEFREHARRKIDRVISIQTVTIFVAFLLKIFLFFIKADYNIHVVKLIQSLILRHSIIN